MWDKHLENVCGNKQFDETCLGNDGFYTYIHTDTHTHKHRQTQTCSEISYRITDVECIERAKTTHLNLTRIGE